MSHQRSDEERFGGLTWGQRGNLVLDCTLEDALIPVVDPKTGEAVLDGDGLPTHERVRRQIMKPVLLAIAQFGPECYASQRRIAHALSVSRASVQKAVRGLEHLGVLSVEQRPGVGASLRTNAMRIWVAEVARRCPPACVDERLRDVLGLVERDGALVFAPPTRSNESSNGGHGGGWTAGRATLTGADPTTGSGGSGPQGVVETPGSGVDRGAGHALSGGGPRGGPGWSAGRAGVAHGARSDPMTEPGLNLGGEPAGSAGGGQPTGSPGDTTTTRRVELAREEYPAAADDREAVGLYLRARVAMAVGRRARRGDGGVAELVGVVAEWAARARESGVAELGMSSDGGELAGFVEWVENAGLEAIEAATGSEVAA